MDKPCPECDGRGEVLDSPQGVLDGRPYLVQCEICHGTGVVPDEA